MITINVDETNSALMADLVNIGAIGVNDIPLSVFGQVALSSKFKNEHVYKLVKEPYTLANEQRLLSVVNQLRTNKRAISNHQMYLLKDLYTSTQSPLSCYKTVSENISAFVFDNIERFSSVLSRDYYGRYKTDINSMSQTALTVGIEKIFKKQSKKPKQFLKLLSVFYAPQHSYYRPPQTLSPPPVDILKLLDEPALINFLMANPIMYNRSLHETAKKYFPDVYATATVLAI